MSLRIIAGQARGTLLKAPQGLATRPTLGRVRESLFMILTPGLPGAAVLDCFAGCGALGLEAISRGASSIAFVEQAPAALAALRENIHRLRCEDRAHVFPRDVMSFLKSPPSGSGAPFDLILLDPPYGQGLCELCLQWLAEAAPSWLAPGGQIVAQSGRRDPLEDHYGVLLTQKRKTYGETQIAFYSLQG